MCTTNGSSFSRTTMSETMSHKPSTFPMNCLDVRQPYYMTGAHWILVLQGRSSPPDPPIFTRGTEVSAVRVDEQGLWGAFEWSILPQLYDSSSPWLCFAPLYRDNDHITRRTIHRDMIVKAEKTEGEKEVFFWTVGHDLKEEIKSYTKGLVSSAELAMATMSKDSSPVDKSRIVWPTTAIERATYLWRRLVVGVPSVNSFQRALASLRRASAELEGFIFWSTVMQASPLARNTVTSRLNDERNIDFRGAFLDGSRDEWLNEASDLRRTYAEMERWGTPVYALVRKEDWDLGVFFRSVGGRVFEPGKDIRGA